MTEPKRAKRREQQAVKTKYFNGLLRCQRCGNTTQVVDFNEHHKVFNCPVCAERTDFQEARKLAA